jgi:hypothetical protein
VSAVEIATQRVGNLRLLFEQPAVTGDRGTVQQITSIERKCSAASYVAMASSGGWFGANRRSFAASQNS